MMMTLGRDGSRGSERGDESERCAEYHGGDESRPQSHAVNPQVIKTCCGYRRSVRLTTRRNLLKQSASVFVEFQVRLDTKTRIVILSHSDVMQPLL
jgi:hypothetical protein